MCVVFFWVRGLKICNLVPFPPGKKSVFQLFFFLIQNLHGSNCLFSGKKSDENGQKKFKNIILNVAHDHSFQATSLKFLLLAVKKYFFGIIFFWIRDKWSETYTRKSRKCKEQKDGKDSQHSEKKNHFLFAPRERVYQIPCVYRIRFGSGMRRTCTKQGVFFIFSLLEVPYLPLKLSDFNKLSGF